MIPSDHFVRFYNEIFKELERRGHEHLVAYWRELGRLQSEELSERFRKGGLRACQEYWQNIFHEEQCEAEIEVTDRYLELRMLRCPSLSKVLDNDAAPSRNYCDHCMAWVQPVMEGAGLYPVYDMISRSIPRCRMRVYTDPREASEFENQSVLPAYPYGKRVPGKDAEK